MEGDEDLWCDIFLEFTFDFVAVRDWRVQTRIDSRVDNAGQVAVDARPINLRGACSYNTECQQKLHRLIIDLFQDFTDKNKTPPVFEL